MLILAGCFILMRHQFVEALSKEVYVVSGGHQDIGFHYGYKRSMDEYALQLKNHIHLIEMNPKIRFSMGNTYNTKDFLSRYPQYKKRLGYLLGQGNITTPAQWVGFEVDWFSGEYLVRSVAYPKAWLMRELDYAPHWAQLNDVPSITPQLAQILAKSNVWFLQVMNERLVYRFPEAEPIRYVGLDGSSVIAYATCYYCFFNLSDGSMKEIKRLKNTFKGFPVKMASVCEDRGVDKARSQRLYRYINQWNANLAKSYGYPLSFKTHEDFAQLLHKEDEKGRLKLRKLTGHAIPWRWAAAAHHPEVMPYLAKASHDLLTVEKLASILEILGVDTYPVQEINKAWEKILWYPDHNWGTGSDVGHFKVRDCREAARITEKLLKSKLNKFASSVAVDRKKGIPVVVFNPLNWKRTEAVEVSVNTLSLKKLAVADAEGEEMLSQVAGRENSTKNEQVKLVFLAKDIPPLGYKTFYIRENRATKSSPNSDLKWGKGYIENSFLRIETDPNGRLKSIYDKKAQRELFADTKGKYKFSLVNLSNKDKNIDLSSAEVIEKGPARAALRLKGTIQLKNQKFPIYVDFYLTNNSSQLDQKITLDTLGNQKTIWSVSLFYPLIFEKSWEKAQVGIPYGSIPFRGSQYSRRAPSGAFNNTTNDGLPFGSSIAPQKWISHNFGDYSLDVAMQNIQTRVYFKRKSTMVHLMNWIPGNEGKMKWRISLQGHKGDWREAHTPRFAWEVSHPLLPVAVKKAKAGSHSAKLPEFLSFMRLDPISKKMPQGNLILTTFKKAFDRNGYVVRFYESEDKDTDATLSINPVLGIPRAEISRTNLVEQPYHLLDNKANSWRIPTLGYGIETVRFFTKPVTDTQKPGKVKDLTAADPTSNTIDLTWTAPGDDGAAGTAQRYEIRYNKSPITKENWSQAATVSPNKLPIPKPAGSKQRLKLGDLASSASYFFALRAQDDWKNWGKLSNVASATTQPRDTKRPGKVNNLQAMKVTSTTASLSWSASGDDGQQGRAASYKLCYAKNKMDETTWELATKTSPLPSPASPRATEKFTVTGLEPAAKYYFGLRVYDEAGNVSLLSNSAVARTASLRTIRLQNGRYPRESYRGCQDTHISAVNDYEVVSNYSQGAYLQTWAGGERSILIKFDLSALPKSLRVHKAYLKLYSFDIAYGNSASVSAYRITKPWEQEQVTWKQSKENLSWGSKPGAPDRRTDFGFGPNGLVARAPVKDGGMWVTFDVSSLLQKWLIGKHPNYGFLVIGNCDEDCEVYFRSSRYKKPEFRPLLEVSY